MTSKEYSDRFTAALVKLLQAEPSKPARQDERLGLFVKRACDEWPNDPEKAAGKVMELINKHWPHNDD